MIKVLIFEDEPLLIQLYKSALDKSEFEVIGKVSNKDVVEEIKSMMPSIILLDVMMPDPNGIEVLEMIKSNSDIKNIPVVMFTNLSGKFDISYALSKGAVEYWIKNEVKVGEIGDKIKGVLKKVQI